MRAQLDDGLGSRVFAFTGYSERSVANVENLRPWPKGTSGNPQGRPKGIAKAFREVADPAEAAIGLLELARNEDIRPADRIAAWRELLDRGYGKSASFAAIEGADPLEQDEVAAEIATIAAQLERDRAA